MFGYELTEKQAIGANCKPPPERHFENTGNLNIAVLITRPTTCLQVLQYIILVSFYQLVAEAAALSRLIPNRFVIFLKPDVDAQAHIVKVQASMDSTASSDSVKSRFTSI
jgi:hypothetical protein